MFVPGHYNVFYKPLKNKDDVDRIAVATESIFADLPSLQSSSFEASGFDSPIEPRKAVKSPSKAASKKNKIRVNKVKSKAVNS